jgi:ABC-2 type transport system permease protein
MDGENISNGLYGMFVGSSLYHGGAFTGVLKAIFIFIVPSLLLGAIPIEIINSFSFVKVLLFIVLTVFWLVFSIYFFYRSLRKYESNNFFGFGG